MKGISKLFILGTVIAPPSVPAFATTIAPGGPAVVASNVNNVTNDGIVAQAVNAAFADSTVSGLQSEFVINDGGNPYADDDLTFLIAVSSNNSSQSDIEQISVGDGAAGFAQFQSVNVGFTGGGYGNDAPSASMRPPLGWWSSTSLVPIRSRRERVHSSYLFKRRPLFSLQEILMSW